MAALTGSGKTLIHTSGSSIVADQARGEPSDRCFDDETPFQPEPDKAARVALDKAVLDGVGFRAIVLCNSMIYGDAIGPEARSDQLPRLVDLARETGVSQFVGRGLNRWSTVHLADVTELYVLALERAPSGFFAFVEKGESRFIDLAQAIAHALDLGAPQSMTSEAAEERWGRMFAIFALGSNSRVRAKHARQLGWAPRHASAEAWIRATQGAMVGHARERQSLKVP